MEPFTVSVLLRKDEYCSHTAYRLPAFAWGLPIGLFLMLCGVTVWLLDFGISVTTAFLIVGVVTALFDNVIAPMLSRIVAGARYDRTRQNAWHLTFTEEAVTVQNAQVNGTFPYSLLTRAEETVHYFMFDFGAELSLCVPRRVLKQQQIQMLQRLL